MMTARAMSHLIEQLPPIRGRALADADLSATTWFRVGGPAEMLVRPADAADLAALLRDLPHEIPVTVIGAASNLIVRDGGVHGGVIRLARGFNSIAVETDGVVAGAAALDVTVAEHAAAAGLAGLEFFSGIPGTIGGAVAMNAGAYGGDVAHCLDWAEIVTRSGEAMRLSCAELAFGYRHATLPRPAWGRRYHRRRHGADPRGARGQPACARPHRRIDLPQSTRHEGLGIDRRGGLPRPGSRRCAGFRKALQFPAECRRRHGCRH
jgi:UDP-N-acetylmuramate dehydrogenase